MYVVQKTLFFLLLAATCLSCKQLEESRLQTKKVAERTAGIAVVYIGAANCHRYLAAQGRSAAEIAQVIDRNKSFGRYITHLVDGDNGELITVEFMQVRHNFDLQFSGDRFLRKLTASTVSMAQIEGSCRRLLLRVDSAGLCQRLSCWLARCASESRPSICGRILAMIMVQCSATKCSARSVPCAVQLATSVIYGPRWTSLSRCAYAGVLSKIAKKSTRKHLPSQASPSDALIAL